MSEPTSFENSATAPAAARRSEPADRGSAMVITLMVLALVTALSTTVAVVTINNLRASLSAQQSGGALNSADAGIAQAMAHMRVAGVRDLDCTSAAPAAPACSRAWGSSNRTTVTMSAATGQSYQVWIESVAPFPANQPGRYRIHSLGKASGSASREVVTDVVVVTEDVPKGIFARTISGGGSASVARESIFSTGCVYQRSKIRMVEGEIDAAYGIPIGVHSSQVITDANGSTQYCTPTNKALHSKTSPVRTCDPAYPYDQDKLGGSLSGTACSSAQTTYPDHYGAQDLNGDGSTDVHGSYIKDDDTLFDLFNINPRGLSPFQVEEYRAIAEAQGNLWTESTGWTSPDEENAVMFFDLSEDDPGGTVDLNDITGFGRVGNLASTDAACTTRSLMIVIEGGNARLNSNQRLAASLFLTSGAPNGQIFKANGTANFIGTMFADNINLTGNVDLSLDPCFIDNVPPGLLEFSLERYRELDR